MEATLTQRRQETDVDDLKLPQLDLAKLRRKRDKVIFAQTMSPKILAKIHQPDEYFEEPLPELDSKFEFEKQLKDGLMQQSLDKQSPKILITHSSNKKPKPENIRQKEEPTWTSVFARQLSNLISFNR